MPKGMKAACASQGGPDLTVHIVVKGAQERHKRQLVPADGRADWQHPKCCREQLKAAFFSRRLGVFGNG